MSVSSPAGAFELTIPLDPVSPGEAALPLELEVFDLTNPGRPKTSVELSMAGFPAGE